MRCIVISPRHIRKSYVRLFSYQSAYDHYNKIRDIVGARNILENEFDMAKYTTDWTKCYRGGGLVCLPGSTSEVSSLLSYCNTNRIGVVPQGGNTGLVGGSVGTYRHELIISLARMNRVIDINEHAGVLLCEAGCILETLNAEVNSKNFIIPLDLAAKGSCMIGGNVATNAGGLRVVKYGSLHGLVIGLEVVQANGTVLDMTTSLRKNNTGYNLNHLFIGSEGTLGVITKVSLLLAPKPSSSNVLLAKVLVIFDICNAFLLKLSLQIAYFI